MKNKKTLLIAVLVAGLLISFLAFMNELSLSSDADADGIVDGQDNCPNLSNPSQEDFDLDRLGNDCDQDDDNDGIVDPVDAFDENSMEWADFDFDSVGDVEDTDDDNDGILDVKDQNPILTTEQLAQKYLDKIQTCSLAETGTIRLLCYSQLFSKIIEQEEKNVDALQLALALTKLEALDDCHFVSHEIGHAAFRENPDVSQNMIGVDGKICRGGFYHGIMAAYFHDLKENNEDLVSYKTVCNDLIGTPDYTNCVHGLGHGLRHYYPDDLNVSITACDQMSFYQSSVCMGGLLMQYTDEKLTQSRDWQNYVPNICPRSDLRDFDYQQCNDSLGLSLAFHTNHNYDEAAKYCELISDQAGKESCFKGLEREIKDAKLYKEYDPTKGVRELFQPMWIKMDSNKWIVDFRSPAIISNFNYDENVKTLSFSFDKPYYIIIYISSDLLPKNPTITVNGKIQNEFELKHGLLFNHSMIRVEPTESGIVVIKNSD